MGRLQFDLIPCGLCPSWHYKLNTEDRHLLVWWGSSMDTEKEGKKEARLSVFCIILDSFASQTLLNTSCDREYEVVLPEL